MIDLLLVHGTVITMDPSRRIIYEGAVAVQGSRILEIGESGVLMEKYKARQTINCSNHCILPGLIDVHGHGGHSMFKTVAMENLEQWMPIMTNTYNHYVTDDFWYYEGKVSALERLKAGITTGVSVIGSTPRADDPILP
nr:amidohydrolase family protein [Planococcus glaciei]